MRSRTKRTRCGGVFDRLEVRQLLSLVLSPLDITATAQVPFNGVAATLVDTQLGSSPNDFNNPPGSVSINWGDGQTGPGVVVGPIFPGVFEVDASHTYTQPGAFSTQISVTDQSGNNAIANGTATVTTTSQSPELSIVANTIGGTAGTPLTADVANFLDPNPADVSTDFAALITWGDGNSSIGTIQGGNGTFTVTGINTYKTSGLFATNVTVVSLNNGLDGFATGEAKITLSSPYKLTGQQFIETSGVPFTVPVATFTDQTTTDPASDFTASINWGNGHSSVGTVTGSDGNFSISGSYDYGLPGTYSVIVTLVDQSNQTAMTTSTVTVTGPVLTPLPTVITPSVGQPFTGTVASFFDTNTSDTAPDLSATITWGNGNVTTGTVVADPGTPELFDVQGTNTYTAAGTYAVSVVMINTSGQTATANSTAIVAAPVIIATGTTFPATPGVALPANTIVANFIDPNSNATPQTITAVINWGDGQTSDGKVNATGTIGSFTVTGTHTYATASPTGSFAVTVTIADPSGPTAKANSTALVVTPLAATGTIFTATPGVALPANTIVANFTDSNPVAIASPSLIAALINWGDGQASRGTVSLISVTGTTGTFTVTGSHTYLTAAASGPYSVSVSVADPSGQTATATSTALVVSSALNPIPATVSFTVGIAPSGPVTVGSFFDSNASAMASDFTATINWGTGQQQSPGMVMASSTTPGLFLVTGTNIYPAVNTYPISILVQDGHGSSTTIDSTANVVTNVVATLPGSTFTGGLDPNTNNGPHASMGYTNTNRPTFSGNAVPFSIVQLYGRFWGVDAVQPLGEAVTNANGQWALPVGPLATGSYTITATVTPPGSYPIAATLASGGVVYIDMTPKTVKVSKHTAAKSAAARKTALRLETLKERKLESIHRGKHKG